MASLDRDIEGQILGILCLVSAYVVSVDRKVTALIKERQSE